MQHEWFQHPEWWFSKNHKHDKYITSTYGHLLNDVNKYDYPLIDKALIYDQLPRHVFRNQAASHIITYFLQKAVQSLKSVEQAAQYATNDAEFMFLMLPFRHTRNYFNIRQVMFACWRRTWTDTALMRKFVRATFMDAPADDQLHFLQYLHVPRAGDGNVGTVSDDIVFDKHIVFDRVLDHNDYTNNGGDPNQCILDVSQIAKDQVCIVSLSGGVDSMVLLDLVLQRTKHVYCVHINYDNKETSHIETDFVAAWCRYNNVPLIVRTCDEIHRPLCMELDLRNVYETYTKRVRFATYQTVWKYICETHHNHVVVQSSLSQPIVLLGHNKDDCFENVVTNSMSKTKYDNLFGMSYVSHQDGVTMVRPLLGVYKKHIIAYARENGIPFLCDSTPVWSQRGKIRDIVVPSLNQFDPKCIDGFLDVASTMSALHDMMMTVVQHHILNLRCNEDAHENTITFTHESQIPRLPVFWNAFFTRAFGCIGISRASIDNFLQILFDKHMKQLKNRTRMIVLSPHLTCRLKSSKNIENGGSYEFTFINYTTKHHMQ